MKKLIFSLAMGSLLIVSLAGCGAKGNASTAFWVRGNCDMCKATIEKALSSTDGVASAGYDLAANTLQVEYDSTKVTVDGLHKACAKAGYDTKLVLADLGAYSDLPKCCKKPEDQ